MIVTQCIGHTSILLLNFLDILMNIYMIRIFQTLMRLLTLKLIGSSFTKIVPSNLRRPLSLIAIQYR